MLSQLATIKDRLKIATADIEDDTQLTRYLNWAQGVFENFCNRDFDRATLTEEFQADAMELSVKNFPIESVTGFELLTTEAEGFLAQTGVDYVLSPKRSIISLLYRMGTEKQKIRVSYVGGYVAPGTTPTGSQIALPSELENAAIEQVCYWYQNRDRLGLVNISEAGGSISQFAQLKLLPIVEMTLRPYIRMDL